MSNDTGQDAVWNLCVFHFKEYEYHDLAIADLRELLQEEWGQQFNGLFIGRDVDCVGRLGIFFRDDRAFVGYEDFTDGHWLCSYSIEACERPDWNELVRLTPDDAEDFSFIRGFLVPKERALQIVEAYLTSGEVTGLYLTGPDGKPLLENI